MLNLLIVTLANKSLSGGSVASRSNYEVFRNTGVFNIAVVGPHDLDYATSSFEPAPGRVQKMLSYARLRPAIDFDAILQAIDGAGLADVDVVFFDTSLLGPLAAGLKKRFPRAYIATFFHNIESMAYRTMMNKRSPLAWTRWASVLRAERSAARYSDYRITLSQSDSAAMAAWLGATADIVWPITYPPADSAPHADPIGENYVLFVGGYYKPNLDAIEYLATRIAPRSRCKIVAAGFNLGKIQDKYAAVPNLVVLDSPPSLAPLYQHANLVLAPIFTGGGIKTKVIEAFSFGKFVVASPEAAVGFDRIPASCMAVARNDDDYVAQINASARAAPDLAIVAQFNQYYSAQAKDQLMQQLLERILARRGARAASPASAVPVLSGEP